MRRRIIQVAFLVAGGPAGEDGFPGNLKVSVRYILTPDNTLRMDYRVSMCARDNSIANHLAHFG